MRRGEREESRLPLAQRFTRNVRKTAGCWLWMRAAQHNSDHGSCAVFGVPVKAHRVAYELFCGPVTKGRKVLHTCDNPRCVRPAHLYLGNQTENMRDMVVRGRANPHRGEANLGGGKLTEARVRQMRRQWDSGAVTTYTALAERSGVSIVMARNIILRKNWAHI